MPRADECPPGRILTMTAQAVVVCSADRGDANRKVGGLSLLERLMRQLSEAGFTRIRVVHPPRMVPSPPSPRVTAEVRFVSSSASGIWPMAADAGMAAGDRVVVVAADLLVDARLWPWLRDHTGDVLVAPGPGAAAECLGVLRASRLRDCAVGATPLVPVVRLQEFPTYSKSHRGHVPFHLLSVATDGDAEAAWGVLLDYVDKRTKDLPAMYFDPWFENRLVRLCAATAVTPNQITLATSVLGFVVAWLFAAGALRIGILLAIAVEVLDGVDGKLARIRHQTSKVGELEHVLDTIYELSWYLGLGWYLSSAGWSWAWPVAVAFCGVDVADNLAYGLFSWRGGGHLDEASAFLRRFRLIGGRRNIYAWLCLPAIYLGRAQVGFAVAAAWAAITATVHWVSALRVPAARGARREGSTVDRAAGADAAA
ncbi:MAG: CDP-alcohol phosphatidyltransferase family protein [Candidatus Binatia bacterium]